MRSILRVICFAVLQIIAPPRLCLTPQTARPLVQQKKPNLAGLYWAKDFRSAVSGVWRLQNHQSLIIKGLKQKPKET